MSLIKLHICPRCGERHFTTLHVVPLGVKKIISQIPCKRCHHYFEESFRIEDMQPDRLFENEQSFPTINV